MRLEDHHEVRAKSYERIIPGETIDGNTEPFQPPPPDNNNNIKVKIFDEDCYAEYEQITGKKIKDLNRQRNFLVETVKKDWKQNRAWHYKQLGKNPFYKEHMIPSNKPILPEDI